MHTLAGEMMGQSPPIDVKVEMVKTLAGTRTLTRELQLNVVCALAGEI